jgi:type II secretory pathway pseudopilin PulG
MPADEEVELAVARLARVVSSSSRHRTLKDRIRAMMAAIEEARSKGLRWKEIHAEIVAAGIPIERDVLANYVCKARREAQLDALQDGRSQDGTQHSTVVVPLRRSKAAARGLPLTYGKGRASETAPDSTSDAAASASAGVNPHPAPVREQEADQYVEILNSGRPTKASRPK